MFSRFPLIAALWLAASLCGAAAEPAPSRPPSTLQACAAVTPATCAVAHALKKGINMGNMLDAPREGDWGVRMDALYPFLVADLFNTVRLPVRWSNHAAPTADATLDEDFARRVDGIVDDFLDRGMFVILDVHHYGQLFGAHLSKNEFAVAEDVIEMRLVNIWHQLGKRYQDRSPRLVFELLNEPQGRLDGEPWNLLAPRLLAAVRASNPERTVMIGPSFWNNAVHLPLLRLPKDRNLIIAVHNFHPFEFTHQGEDSRKPPFPTGVTCCDKRQHQEIATQFEMAERWSRATGYPLHLGEFGAYQAADRDSRAAYVRVVRQEAERRGIGWAYWEFASTFGIYSPETRQWIEPLKKALVE